MRASPREIATLAQNMTLLATYWMSFEFAREPRAPQDDKTLARGAFQVMSLAAPYLEPRRARPVRSTRANVTSHEEAVMAPMKWKPFNMTPGLRLCRRGAEEGVGRSCIAATASRFPTRTSCERTCRASQAENVGGR